MSINKFISKYTLAETHRILEEDSDNAELDEDIEQPKNAPPQNGNGINSSHEKCTVPEDISSSSSDEEDDTLRTTTTYSRNGVTWTPLLSARAVQSSASNIVGIKSGVSSCVRFKAGSSSYKCWKLFIDNAMLKSI